MTLVQETITVKRERRTRDGRRLGLMERIMFSFMGPPQVGDVNSPRTVEPDPQAALCHKCGRAWEQHEIVRTASMTYARCPDAQD
ncbi:MAG TPA: hypothetical protein VFR07_10430 [Mycobacteriales bacterium]|nr:hypothetical protein [Mycobacteriales bacterium]